MHGSGVHVFTDALGAAASSVPKFRDLVTAPLRVSFGCGSFDHTTNALGRPRRVHLYAREVGVVRSRDGRIVGPASIPSGAAGLCVLFGDNHYARARFSTSRPHIVKTRGYRAWWVLAAGWACDPSHYEFPGMWYSV